MSSFGTIIDHFTYPQNYIYFPHDMLYLVRKIKQKESPEQDGNRTYIFQRPTEVSTVKLLDFLILCREGNLFHSTNFR